MSRGIKIRSMHEAMGHLVNMTFKREGDQYTLLPDDFHTVFQFITIISTEGWDNDDFNRS